MPCIFQHAGQTLLTFPAQFRVRLLTVFFLALVPLHADDTKDLQKHLQERFLKKVFTIRNFYGGDHLIFDTQGKLIEGDAIVGYNGCWTGAGIDIQKLELKKDRLVLRGPRVIQCYNFQNLDSSVPFRQKKRLEIDIRLDSAQMNELAITGILEKVFLTRADNLINLVPDSWRAEGFIPGEKEFAQINQKDVTPPKAINALDPEYSEAASRAKLQGMVVLWAGIDEHGNPVEIKILRCLGLGLDEQSVQAVTKWKFEPAQKNGQPIPVQLIITMEFHQY